MVFFLSFFHHKNSTFMITLWRYSTVAIDDGKRERLLFNIYSQMIAS
jgi:hypothetical protein